MEYIDFTERFNSYSNSQLLGIIENPNDYQPEAVETAKAIILSRQLTENELEIAKNELDAEKLEKTRKEQNKKELRNKLKGVGKSVFDNVNPVQDELPSMSKTIKTISVLLGILFLAELYKEFGMIHFMFTDSSAGWNLSTILSLFVLLIMAMAVIFFWKKKKAGWILAGISLTYEALSAIQMFFLLLKMEQSGVEVIDLILPSVPPINYLFAFLFYIGIIIIISRKKIRTVYSVSIPTMISTIALTIFFIGAIIYSFDILADIL